MTTKKKTPTTTTPTTSKRIKVAILVDFAGALGLSAEEEVENHKRRVRTWFPGREDDLDFSAPVAPIFDTTPDLIIYDFGGLMPGSGLMESNARAIVNYANDHPNTLVIVASEFTMRNYVKHAMEDIGMESAPNIVARELLAVYGEGDEVMLKSDLERNGSPIPEWWMAGL